VTLEEVEERPCDFYVAVLLKKSGLKWFELGEIVGYATLQEVKSGEVVKGFQANYAIPYEGLQPIEQLKDFVTAPAKGTVFLP